MMQRHASIKRLRPDLPDFVECLGARNKVLFTISISRQCSPNQLPDPNFTGCSPEVSLLPEVPGTLFKDFQGTKPKSLHLAPMSKL